MSKGINIDFCWIPSHCGIVGNEIADKLAKEGARQKHSNCTLKLDKNEIISILENRIHSEKLPFKHSILSYPRNLSCLIYKIRLNAWKSKFSKNVECACGHPINILHILFNCPILLPLFRMSGIDIAQLGSLQNVVYSKEIAKIASVISNSSIARFL